MSTKAKIIIALVVVAIIVGVTIWLYKKKKGEKGTTKTTDATKTALATTTTEASKAIKEAGPLATETVATTEMTKSFDFRAV